MTRLPTHIPLLHPSPTPTLKVVSHPLPPSFGPFSSDDVLVHPPGRTSDLLWTDGSTPTVFTVSSLEVSSRHHPSRLHFLLTPYSPTPCHLGVVGGQCRRGQGREGGQNQSWKSWTPTSWSKVRPIVTSSDFLSFHKRYERGLDRQWLYNYIKVVRTHTNIELYIRKIYTFIYMCT